MNKKNKERIFKWSVKKNRSFDVRDMVKWCVRAFTLGMTYAICRKNLT